MKSEKLVIEELSRMKSLFGYERGRVISEQESLGTKAMKIPTQFLKQPSSTTTIDFNKLPQKIDNIWNSTNELVAAGFPNTGNILADPNFAKYYDRGYSDTTGNYFWTKKKTAPAAAPQTTTTPVTPVGSATKPPVPRKPDPKVIELQKQIKAALPNFDLGKSGPNKDGVDGIMGAKTQAGQKLMIQQKGQQALQNLSAKGQDFKNKNIARINQYQAPTAPAAPVASAAQAAPAAAPVPPGPKPTGLGFANEERDGWYYDAKTKDWYTEPQ